MTFNEWLEAYYSGTQIDDVTFGMMRTAFEAGKCETGTVGLRDKFAMAALQGMLANSHPHYEPVNIHYAARDSYMLADAMIKERMK